MGVHESVASRRRRQREAVRGVAGMKNESVAIGRTPAFSHEEGPQRMLEGGDGTGGVGEGGQEMGEDVLGRSLRRPGQLGRRTARRQCRADLALSLVEAFPDALPGPVAEMTVGGADGGGDGAGGGVLEEAPQSAGGQAEASDFVGEPDAEGPPATAACIAVAAKDPPGALGLALGAAFVITAQKAVPNERADGLAVRAGRLLEPFANRRPFRVAAVKPSLIAHGNRASAKIVILPARQRGGVVAGYDEDHWQSAGYESWAGSFAEFSVQETSTDRMTIRQHSG